MEDNLIGASSANKKYYKDRVMDAGKGFVKGLISEIPYIGSPIIGAWDGYYSGRTEDMIGTLRDEVEKLGENKIDLTYVMSEEFVDLFSKALRIRQQSRSKKKAKLIVALIMESIDKDRNIQFDTSIKETFLSFLSELSDNEISFLINFSRGSFEGKTIEDIYQDSNKQHGLALDGLIAKGILREDSTWSQKVISTRLGSEFIEYLKMLCRNEDLQS